jgi:hypothetical protein
MGTRSWIISSWARSRPIQGQVAALCRIPISSSVWVSSGGILCSHFRTAITSSAFLFKYVGWGIQLCLLWGISWCKSLIIIYECRNSEAVVSMFLIRHLLIQLKSTLYFALEKWSCQVFLFFALRSRKRLQVDFPFRTCLLKFCFSCFILITPLAYMLLRQDYVLTAAFSSGSGQHTETSIRRMPSCCSWGRYSNYTSSITQRSCIQCSWGGLLWSSWLYWF